MVHIFEGYFCCFIFAPYIQSYTKRKTILEASWAGCFVRESKPGAQSHRKAGRAVPLCQRLSLVGVCKAGPEIVTSFCQPSRLSEMSAVSGRSGLDQHQKGTRLGTDTSQHRLSRDQGQVSELKNSSWVKKGWVSGEDPQIHSAHPDQNWFKPPGKAVCPEVDILQVKTYLES